MFSNNVYDVVKCNFYVNCIISLYVIILFFGRVKLCCV